MEIHMNLIEDFINLKKKNLEVLGLTVELNHNFEYLESFLSNREDYPYDYDRLFQEKSLKEADLLKSFILLAKDNDKIVATYAARDLDIHKWFREIERWSKRNGGEYLFEHENIFQGLTVYSSCQWVSSEYRGKNIGINLDHIKKAISLQKFNWDLQFSFCKETLKEYHIENLNYKRNEFGFWVPGGFGGSGDSTDKNYYINWITKEEALQWFDNETKI